MHQAVLVSGVGSPHYSVLLSNVSHANYQALLVSVPANLPVEVPPERRLYAGVDNFPRQDQPIFIPGRVGGRGALRCAGHSLQLTTELPHQAGPSQPTSHCLTLLCPPAQAALPGQFSPPSHHQTGLD